MTTRANDLKAYLLAQPGSKKELPIAPFILEKPVNLKILCLVLDSNGQKEQRWVERTAWNVWPNCFDDGHNPGKSFWAVLDYKVMHDYCEPESQ